MATSQLEVHHEFLKGAFSIVRSGTAALPGPGVRIISDETTIGLGVIIAD